MTASTADYATSNTKKGCSTNLAKPMQALMKESLIISKQESQTIEELELDMSSASSYNSPSLAEISDATEL